MLFMQLPALPVRIDLLKAYARFVAAAGDPASPRPLVLPSGKFFPDLFQGDQASLDRLAHRMQALSGLQEVELRLEVLDGEGSGGGCSTGACAPSAPVEQTPQRLEQNGSVWTLRVMQAEVGNPVALTANLARVLGHAFASRIAPQASPERAALAGDLAAVSLGFGHLLLEGSYIYSKSCGGPSIGRVTALSCPEVAVLVAAFLTLQGQSARAALKHGGVTQQALLKEAFAWMSTNREMTRALRADPKTFAESEVHAVETQPWLVRLFGSGKAKPPRAPQTLDEMEAWAERNLPGPSKESSKDSASKDDGLRQLVDEALGPK